MIRYAVLAFFFVFLTSRFFTEVLRIVPKWVDLVDLPFIAILFVITLVRIPRPDIDHREHRFFTLCVVLTVLIWLLSTWINIQDTLVPAAILFIVGMLQGPVLYLSLNRGIQYIEATSELVLRLFIVLMFFNLAVVVFHNFPLFIATGNPDFISGTYGGNAYLFSIFIVISGGLTLGLYRQGRWGLPLLILSQLFTVIIYYFIQFRAGLPFFIFAYGLMLWGLYGRRTFKYSLVIGIVLFGALLATSNIITASERRTLRYEDWQKIVASPTEYFQYGKFQAYARTLDLFSDQPESIFVGVGPGNYVSRANYTFSYELRRSGTKGVGKIISDVFGIERPHFTRATLKYIADLRGEAVLGSYQLSNPNSSYLSAIAELGLIGGGAIILMYLYLIFKALFLVRLARDEAPDYLPLATALLGSAMYLLGLAFLDNYWETARATLPVWLLFWATSAGIHAHLENEIVSVEEENEVEYAY